MDAPKTRRPDLCEANPVYCPITLICPMFILEGCLIYGDKNDYPVEARVVAMPVLGAVIRTQAVYCHPSEHEPTSAVPSTLEKDYGFVFCAHRSEVCYLLHFDGEVDLWSISDLKYIYGDPPTQFEVVPESALGAAKNAMQANLDKALSKARAKVVCP